MAALRGCIGLALGSGAARGWAHVGVIRTLEAAGISPDVVCGSSIGAVVAALYACERLDSLEKWGRSLDWKQVVSYLDPSFRGGLIKARRVLDFLTQEIGHDDMGTLPRRFASVATDLATGQEVWIRDGSLYDAVLASMAVPGLVAPVRQGERWLADGGLVNPVPVSLCRALGAESVVAVDLNTTLLGRRVFLGPGARSEPEPELAPDPTAEEAGLTTRFQGLVSQLRERMSRGESRPGLYDVVTTSINIMQMRISRSRMAGDPPELLVTPRLPDFALLDFDRAEEGIEEGRQATLRALEAA